ncbi:uncharacterized protein [Watersipora subatra]|uniref:uncharacterized protein n=1 Tax=Watersipora subatra TaxID=2589382 RepID=UPI00355C633E
MDNITLSTHMMWTLILVWIRLTQNGIVALAVPRINTQQLDVNSQINNRIGQYGDTQKVSMNLDIGKQLEELLWAEVIAKSVIDAPQPKRKYKSIMGIDNVQEATSTLEKLKKIWSYPKSRVRSKPQTTTPPLQHRNTVRPRSRSRQPQQHKDLSAMMLAIQNDLENI